jgi:hypothetical protein
MPPDKIASNQNSIAREANYLDWSRRSDPSHETHWDVLADQSRSSAISQGCPPEALSNEALHWTYIMQQRSNYSQAIALPPAAMSVRTNTLFSATAVDHGLITEPLTDEQFRAAGAWKILYLQRLRRENTDESYIDAYLQAWSLAPDQVFGSANR